MKTSSPTSRVKKTTPNSPKPSKNLIKRVSKIVLDMHNQLNDTKDKIEKIKKSVTTLSDDLVTFIYTNSFYQSVDSLDQLKMAIYDQNNWKRQLIQGGKESGINKTRTSCNNTVSKYFSYIRSYIERGEPFDNDTDMKTIRESYENRGNRIYRKVALYNCKKLINTLFNNNDLTKKQIKELETEITKALVTVLQSPPPQTK
tara:strand:+ start:1126 stop:1728 length:603 start_codon:yes stop_codon:yes gene_type:complete